VKCSPPSPASLRPPGPEENPPAGKNFGTNSIGGRPSDLGGLPTGPGSYVGVVQKETRKQHRSPEEVIRRRVGLARRCSRGSGRPYGSLAARAGQNQWLLTGHPRLATVKGRMLFLSGITIPFALLLVERSLLDEVLLPFILLPPDRASTPSASICARGGSESSPR